LLLIVARLRTRHAQYDLGYKYFVYFSGRWLFAFNMEKNGVMQCNEMTTLTDSIVPLPALF